MVKHIIIWELDKKLSDEEKLESAKKIKAGLEGLKGVIDGLEEITVHIGLLGSSSGDLMLDSTFTGTDALAGYQTNPEHLKVAAFVRSVTSHRSCADFEI
ncbi:MAG: Dabb family protein [Ruminococcus sp.]|nr:Dabb family protein [Ruminococcus sp.]